MKKQEVISGLIGEYLVRLDVLREDQVLKILEHQQQTAAAGVRSLFGEIAIRLGWLDSGDVNQAIEQQSADRLGEINFLEFIINLKLLSKTQVKEYHLDSFSSVEDLEHELINQGLVEAQELHRAKKLWLIRKSNNLNLIRKANYVPLNIMELIIAEYIDQIIRQDELCRCSQCWSNIFSIAANELPNLYVSEYSMLPAFLERYREEYGFLIRQKIFQARDRVRVNPKAACRARFSDDILNEREMETKPLDVIVHVSNHHIHLCQKDLYALFGKNHSLKKMKNLWQPGQYAAEETVTLEGPKGRLDRVRVLGPVRSQTQVEISGTDQFILGIKAPVRPSGHITGSPGINVRGPMGTITLQQGVIRAHRHIHMTLPEADQMGVKDGEMVSVRLAGDRTTILENVLIRATANSCLEMHIDTDEANAAGLPAESTGQVLIGEVNV